MKRFFTFLSTVLVDQISSKLLKLVLAELLRKSTPSLQAAITNFGRNVDAYIIRHAKILGVVYISILKRLLKESEFSKSRLNNTEPSVLLIMSLLFINFQKFRSCYNFSYLCSWFMPCTCKTLTC